MKKKKQTDSVYKRGGGAAAGEPGRIYEEEGEGGMKNKGRDGHFSTLRAVRLRASLPLSLYTWHLSDISPQCPSSCVRLLSQGLSTHRCLPLKSTLNQPLLQSAFPYTVTPTRFHPATSTALTWLPCIHSHIRRGSWNTPQTVVGEQYLVSGQTYGKRVFVVAPWSTRRPRGYGSVLGRQRSLLM